MSAIIQDPAFVAGSEFSLRGEYPGAIAAFEAAMARFPEDAEGPFQLGLAWQRRAEAILPPALREKGIGTGLGDLAASALGLGVVAASKALGQTEWIVQYREAFRQSALQFEAAILLNPQDPRFFHALALSRRYLGQTEAAAEAARSAAALSPGEGIYRERAKAFDQAASRESGAKEAKNPAPVGVTWNDVILPERTKRELKQMQLLLENPSLSRELGIEPPPAFCSTDRRERARRRSHGCWPTNRTVSFSRPARPRSIPCGWGRVRRRLSGSSMKPAPKPRLLSFWTR